MKKLLLMCGISLVSLWVVAQEPTLSRDEKGKLIHYEVISVQTPLDTLKLRLKTFFQARQKQLKLDKGSSDITMAASGKVIVSKGESFLSHPDGEIWYRFAVELKEKKYRFWLTDFEFLPYQRDRYGNFVPATTVKVPLEKTPSKINAAQWKNYQKQVEKFVHDFATKFKDIMANANTEMVNPKRKTITKEW